MARATTDRAPTDRVGDLLVKTSRTFALSIPLLPEPTRRQIGVAYLLFRIADTFEDAAEWDRSRRLRALHDFVDLLREPDADRALALGRSWSTEAPIEHEGYLELLRDTAVVMASFEALAPAAREIIRRHTIRTSEGMARFVKRTDDDGVLRLDDADDLRAYCYTVAGIVGELSTELFLLDRDGLEPIRDFLASRAARFGEALQLVNILKDSAFDTTEGRCYLPPEVDRGEIFALAREDLGIAAEYTLALQDGGAPRGVVAFCALPIRLAQAALRRVEESGPGAKISRERVYEIVDAMNRALDEGRPAVSA